MVKYSKREALQKIKEICEAHKVPIVFYSEDDFPDGAQGSDNVISISKKDIHFKYDGDEAYWVVKYQPWIRVMPSNLDLESFDTILAQGKRVRDCVAEINFFFENKKVVE